MKHTRLWIVLCIAALLLSGCAQKSEQDEKTVGIFTRDVQHDNAEAVRVQALEKALTAAGYIPKHLDGKGDQSIQTQQLESLLKGPCSGIVIHPVMMSAAPELIAMAQEENVPIIFIGQQLSEELRQQWQKVGNIYLDPEQPGIQQGNILAQQPDRGDINGDGTLSYVLIWDMKEYTDTQLHTAGVHKALTDAQILLYQLGIGSAEGDREKARERCAALLAEFGKDIEVVICSTDEMALGALEAIEEGGRTVGKDIYLVGIGGTEEALQAVSEGKMTGTVREDAQAASEYAVLLLRYFVGDGRQENIYPMIYMSVRTE